MIFNKFRINWKILSLLLSALIAFPLSLTVVYSMIPPVSTLMIYNIVSGKRVEREWLPISDMSDNLQRAVVMSEDGKFCEHNGVDWEELQKQLENFNKGERTRGASTITMQVAKNLFLWHGRSYVRKVIELPLAIWVDFVLGKKRILEIYLNTAEWGEGIFGANAATNRYFGKSAESLTRDQAALMAAALPNPIVKNPTRPSNAMRKHANTIRRRMVDADSYLNCLSD